MGGLQVDSLNSVGIATVVIKHDGTELGAVALVFLVNAAAMLGDDTNDFGIT